MKDLIGLNWEKKNSQQRKLYGARPRSSYYLTVWVFVFPHADPMIKVSIILDHKVLFAFYTV